jgi:short-subunit dehydrogenase
MLSAMKPYDYNGKVVLITGASMGIGEAFARELARRGARLVLVARSEARLRSLAAELGGAMVLVEDLARRGAAQRVFDAITAEGLMVDVLINNAGFGTYGPFAELSLETQREELDLNIGAVVELSHVFLPMLERAGGGLIQVASTAAFQPVPYMAVYAASKAFVLSFSEALWAEYKQRGVRVLGLCPGATDTPFFERTGDAAAVGKKARPEHLVVRALRAFDHNRCHMIHGVANYFTAQSSRFVPRELTLKIAHDMMAPKPRLAKRLPAQ